MDDERPAGTADKRFFGHPVGLGYLAFTEVWERFSYYGMQALLPLYMVSHLFKPQNAERVVGLDAFRASVESITGPLTNIAFGSQVFGLYVGGVYLTILLGGWIGDRLIGRTPAVVLGGALMAAGHLTMASERFFLAALLLLITGAGLFKGNLIVQLGGMYSTSDSRRTRAFAIYGISVSLGALLAPLVCGTLGEVYGWHYGFGAAAVGMAVALVIYIVGMRHLPNRPPREDRLRDRAAKSDYQVVAALLLVFLSYALIIAAMVQAYSVGLVWAADHVDRNVLGFQVPVTWLLVWDGVASIAAMFLAMRIWTVQSRKQQEPNDTTKLIIAGFLCATAFLLLFLSGAVLGTDKTSLGVMILFFGLLAGALAYLDAPLKAVTTRCAPPRMATTMVGLMLATFGIANIAGGAVGRFYESLGVQGFWILNAAICATGSLILVLTMPWTKKHLNQGNAVSPSDQEFASGVPRGRLA
jgi:POT family proton-dependent oligopeptide transporter